MTFIRRSIHLNGSLFPPGSGFKLRAFCVALVTVTSLIVIPLLVVDTVAPDTKSAQIAGLALQNAG